MEHLLLIICLVILLVCILVLDIRTKHQQEQIAILADHVNRLIDILMRAREVQPVQKVVDLPRK